MPNQFIDMTGKVFGLWTVLRRYDALRWTARCGGCGELGHIRGDALRSGASKACSSCAARKRRKKRCAVGGGM